MAVPKVPRQPALIAKQKGLYRPSRHGNIDESVKMEHLSAVPEPPDNLGEHGARFWNDMLSELLKVNGLIVIPDLPAFQIMATKYQTIMECHERLRSESKWVMDKDGNTKENPVLLTLEKAEKIFISLSREFGCTPSARNGLKVKGNEVEKDPLSGFSL